MKRKVHIILRFSKHVNPPVPAASSESSAKFTPTSVFSPITRTVTGPSATPLAKPVARESSENEGAGARSDKRNRNIQDRYHERSSSTHSSESSLRTPSPALSIAIPASQLIGKRKRHTPKSIGGGKGDLQPPSKKARRSSTSKQTRVQTTPTPNGGEKKDGDKRITRSQDTQQKSELVEWFEDRDDDDDFVDIDVQMTIIHRDASLLHTLQPSNTKSNGLPNGKIANGAVNLNGSEKAHPLETTAPETPGIGSQNLIPSTSDVLVQTVDLESEARSSHSRLARFTADPLTDDLYIKSHRGMGREEKRLRNVERDKAAYDKQRYEERLEKLRGTDWIKTFNLGGIAVKLGNAEMEKRRQVVIKWHESLLEKFKAWKEEERRQKAAKGGRLSRSMTNSQERDTAESEDLHDQTSHNDDDEQIDEEEDIYAIVDDSDDAGDNSYHSKQYRHMSKPSKGAHRFPYAESPKKKQSDLKPFTSFYGKSHMRLAAISTGRKSSRNLTAFGEPLPEIEEKEFLLPDEFFQQTARHMRARRRVSK